MVCARLIHNLNNQNTLPFLHHLHPVVIYRAESRLSTPICTAKQCIEEILATTPANGMIQSAGFFVFFSEQIVEARFFISVQEHGDIAIFEGILTHRDQ